MTLTTQVASCLSSMTLKFYFVEVSVSFKFFSHLFRIALGNYSDPHSLAQMERARVFLHPPGKFSFFTEADSMPDNYKIDHLVKYDISYFLN